MNNYSLLNIHSSPVYWFFLFIIGGVMLWGFIRLINNDRVAEGKKGMGCIPTLIVAIIVISIWVIMDYLTS